jgi:hypothetical protein
LLAIAFGALAGVFGSVFVLPIMGSTVKEKSLQYNIRAFGFTCVNKYNRRLVFFCPRTRYGGTHQREVLCKSSPALTGLGFIL